MAEQMRHEEATSPRERLARMRRSCDAGSSSRGLARISRRFGERGRMSRQRHVRHVYRPNAPFTRSPESARTTGTTADLARRPSRGKPHA